MTHLLLYCTVIETVILKAKQKVPNYNYTKLKSSITITRKTVINYKLFNYKS